MNTFTKEFATVSENYWVIDSLKFDTFSHNEILRNAVIRIVHPVLYNSNKPAKFGLLDPALGIGKDNGNLLTFDSNSCSTCSQNHENCVGHWGYFVLPFPIIHPGYIKYVTAVLQSICIKCSRLCLPSSIRKFFKRKIEYSNRDILIKASLFSKLIEICKKQDVCEYCSQPRGTIKKVNLSRADSFMKFYYELQSTNGSTSNTKYTVELTPEMIYSFFEKIPENDRALIFTQNPEKFIMKVIPIPPSSIRPSINLMDSGTNEDDLTIVLKDIIFTSIQLEDAIKNGNNYNKIQSLRDILQVQYVRFINSDYPQLNNVINSLSRIGNVIKQGRGVSQRLKGKDGRFRGNLSGKRVDFSGRTVISPDCNCSVEHVVIPEFCAKRMTYPEKVTIFNIEKLKQCILNGPNNWPGALSVTKLAQKQKISLRFVQCKSVADNLKVGDIVERHLANNDYVLFNRQPSLHRMSIMCHNVTVLPERTLRFNECVCGPYNADFDGDEMNIHLPQTEEAKAEAKFLMSIKENLRTPRNGSPVVAATQDFLSGSWLMTYKDVFFTRFQITQYVSYFCDALLKIDIPIPAIIKPVELWTGKQLYGLLIRSHKEDPTLVSLELAEKNYSKSNPKYPWMCRNDGYVIIQRSEIICGTLGKSVLGSGNKHGLIAFLIEYNSSNACIVILNRLSKLFGRWLTERGMTIGIEDVTPNSAINEDNKELIVEAYKKIDFFNKEYSQKLLIPDSGSTVKQTLERRTKSILDSIREGSGKKCIKHLHPLNKPLIMFYSGSKGSLINIAQMTCLIGQQNVNGERIWNGFVGRTLPHFWFEESDSPRAKGFVQNSFYSGLDPDEFFFHTMSGREGLVDTAVKTAETGYLQRRLVKALEDLSIRYDNTLRTSSQHIVQFVYGDDSLNVQLINSSKQPFDIDKIYEHICRMRVLTLGQILQITLDADLMALQMPNSTLVTNQPFINGLNVAKFCFLPPTDLDYYYKELPNFLKKTNFCKHIPNFPKLLLQKLESLKICIENGNSYYSYQQLLEYLSDVTKTSDQYLNTIRDNLLVWKLIHDDFLPAVRLLPLLPYEIIQWVEFLIFMLREYCTETSTFSFTTQYEAEHPNDPKINLTKKTFIDQIRLWAGKHVKSEVDRRILSGQNPALTWEDYYQEIKDYAYFYQQFKFPTHFSHIPVTPFTCRLLIIPKALFNSFGQFPSSANILFIKSLTNLEILYKLIQFLWIKFQQAQIHPGDPVGAISAQSIGEPGTQMTLKTFHFAGVASMNVTLGVPRLKEIINATLNISSPIFTIPLALNKSSYYYAQMIQAKILCIRLGSICKWIEETISAFQVTLVIQLNDELIKKNFLPIDSESVISRIKDTSAIKKKIIRACSFKALNKYKFIIYPPQPKNQDFTSFEIHNLIQELQKVPISGMSSIKQAIITENTNPDTKAIEYNLVAQGTGLLNILNTEGIDTNHIKYNNIMEISQVLGIEAARQSIINEVFDCLNAYNISIDTRHVALLGDVMTSRGEVLGISRQGIEKMKSSVLCLASFEQTNDHLFEAAAFQKKEKICGVSESIILGRRINLGTGCFDLLQHPVGFDIYKSLSKPHRKTFLETVFTDLKA